MCCASLLETATQAELRLVNGQSGSQLLLTAIAQVCAFCSPLSGVLSDIGIFRQNPTRPKLPDPFPHHTSSDWLGVGSGCGKANCELVAVNTEGSSDHLSH